MRDRKMYRFFEQARGMRLDCAAMRGSLTGKLGLNLGSDVNGDRHAAALLSSPAPTLPRRP
jgi:hypothetical protein